MFRLGLLATLAALILTSCVSTYGYRSGEGADYYYAEPSIDYYDGYGRPYGSIGYGYPGGWYGSFGYGFGYGYGYTPYSHHGFPYGYDNYRYGYPYSYYPYPYRRPPHHHRPPHHRPPTNPPPPGTPPPGIIIGGDGQPPDDGPRLGDRDDQPWRERTRRRIMTPQPALTGNGPPPGVVARPSTRRIMVPQPGMVGGGQERPVASQARRVPMAVPQPASEPRPRREMPRAEPAPQRRIEQQERESRRDPGL